MTSAVFRRLPVPTDRVHADPKWWTMEPSHRSRVLLVGLATASVLLGACTGDGGGEPTDSPATSPATASSQPDDPTESPTADATQAAVGVDASDLLIETDFGDKVCVSITNPEVPDSVSRCVSRRRSSRVVELAYEDAISYVVGISRDGGRVNLPRTCSATHQAVSRNGRITVDWCEVS